MRRIAGAVVVIAATCFVLFATQPAYATYPGKNGRISFRRYLNAQHTWGAIFTINPDGTGERQVTHPKRGVLNWQQDWSPNGRWIAFRTHEQSDEVGDIGLVHPSGKALHLITSGRGKWASCSFSANGKKIAGAWPAGGLPSNADVYVMNLDDTHLRNVTKSRPWESAPDWGLRAG